MNDNFNYCHVVGKTDVGRKRAANEDNMYNTITQNGLVSVVCDGMGGHVGGATASKIAVSTIIENLNNIYYDDPRIAIGESIDKANRAIIQKTIEQPELTGMGSTCVLLLVRDGKVYIGHVGDSRIYLVRSKRIVQLTKDHSYVQMLVDCGEITKEQAEHHPRKNEITNALGIPNMSPATVADDAIVPEAGDCFVLCSDGLSGMVSDDTICKIISRQSEMNAQERVDRLVALANDNGGVDNITVQLVEFSVSPNVAAHDRKLPTWAKITGIVFSALFAIGIGICLHMRNKPATEEETSQKTDNTEQRASNQHSPTERSVPLDFSVVFKKNAKIVEFVFTDSESKFIINNEEYKEQVAFDPTSLTIKTESITKTSDNRTQWISFTEKFPGGNIEFSVTTLDKKFVYNYSIKVTKRGVSYPKGTIQKQGTKREEHNNAKPKKEEIVAKVDTIPIPVPPFEYDKLENEARLVLNYSSANPSIIFNNNGIKDVKLDTISLDRVLDKPKYNELYWAKSSRKGQLSFKFKGNSSDEQHEIIIPCAVKNSEDIVIIHVKIIPKQKKQDDDKTLEKEISSEEIKKTEQPVND